MHEEHGVYTADEVDDEESAGYKKGAIMTIDVSDQSAILEYTRDRRSEGGPTWRWDLAGAEAHRRPDRFLRLLGQQFLDVLHYRTLCAHIPVGLRQAQAVYPNVAAAEKLNDDLWKTGHLKVAVLGGLDLMEISQRFGIDQPVLDTWEKTFYDVRGLREATGWIQTHPRTQSYVARDIPVATDDGAERFYQPLLDGIRAIVAKRGWPESAIMLGIGSDHRPPATDP